MNATAGRQMPLPVHLRDDATLENFLAARDGTGLLGALGQLQGQGAEPVIFLHGGSGSGKTHLLQACCHRYGSAAMYLPLADLAGFAPGDVLAGAPGMPLVCLDDLQSVLGDPAWEMALFNFYNESRERGNALLIAADAAPRSLAVGLPDLQSRLTWGVVYRLETPDDERRCDILQFRAGKRGLDLPREVASYLVRRAPRSMDHLLALLDELDRASLAQKRALSIPFVKQVLEL